ncbi:MAG TPA: pyruvate, phosphate dikinase [Baekduia sp.]|nr:pyruvate, phosphate dikinase [Baekduia sp.]
MASSQRWVYDFADGDREMRDLLGGKGANVAEMTRVLGPERVPSGFTITTEACVSYMDSREFPPGLDAQLADALARLQSRVGKQLGDPSDPLLVSVRSGARESMPGMLDTVLNLGLNDASVAGLASTTGNERFAWDSYRRLVQMFGNVVLGLPGDQFEKEIARVKRERGVKLDTELDVTALQELTRSFQALYDFPQEPLDQLDRAVRAVFDSWTGERAVSYRRINHIPDAWGTAVNVQQMVFGNKGENSGSGVAFSRDEVTGESQPSGDFLSNAQGEDVVSGVRNTRDISELGEWQPQVHTDLIEILRSLEAHYKDMQDCEFTVEEGRLYMLQTRAAKRPAQAAVRFAVDAVEEGLLTREEAIATIDPDNLDALLHPTLDPSASFEVVTTGVAASPGAAGGKVVFTAADAIAAEEDVILVRQFTEAEDVAGFYASKGILTSEGGKASHAALVARGMGVPAVTGATDLVIDLDAGEASINDTKIRAGDWLVIDGSTGRVTSDEVALVEPEMSQELAIVLAWCDELRNLGVRANADTPEDARRALELGAEGIGLCRTEHMFLGDRQQLMADVILAEDRDGRYEQLKPLQPLQQADFAEIFAAMEGRPVTIRLLDPPLHEFLPHPGDLPEGSRERARAESLQEANPMLGTRGVRLGILYPEIYAMQVKAIADAINQSHEDAGVWPVVEIMIPLVAYETELAAAVDFVEQIMGKRGLERGERYTIGTMIELPRACIIADKIAPLADFFSFGTNDLTQTALGFSRDDIEGKILARYIDTQMLDRSPFETLDTPGVGELLRLGIKRGRGANPALKLGVCGEHGGDPGSIDFFHEAGLDYVSCSPYRVPIARVAAAQAAIRQAAKGDD